MVMAGLGTAHAGRSEKTVVRRHIPGVKMALTEEKINVLNAKEDPVMVKVLKAVVRDGHHGLGERRLFKGARRQHICRRRGRLVPRFCCAFGSGNSVAET